uniref:Uncharacterized protein n=1 Tax=Dicentrarchus labrax TaxID=13489 RepID=A0A8C4I5M7_DICLA
MNVKKQLWSLARIALPGVGFPLTCSGAYLVSLQTEYGFSWKVIPAYIMIVLGFLSMLIGVFWTICHSMKSKMYQRGGHERNMHKKCLLIIVVVDGVDVVMSLAPPLYSQDSSEAPDCTWSWEQPPRYSQVERIQQGDVDTEERREALSGH